MNGVIILDKPAGITSHTAVQIVKRIFGAKKAGHTGTLDPLATGVLPICLGSSTKLSSKLMEGDKEYEVEMLLGVSTSTYDIEGEVTKRSDVPADIVDIKDKAVSLLPEFTGLIKQVPPHFSAVKHKGRPLYKWAREGRFIDAPPRMVEIKRFEIEGGTENTLLARIVCSKGTYIRSLCHELGERLGTGACVKALRRVATGQFHIKDSVPLDELKTCRSELELQKYVLSNII